LCLTLAVLGLVLAPLARPAAAMTMNAPSMDQAMVQSMSPSMPADMECCPHDAIQAVVGKVQTDNDAAKMPCGKDCPQMAACIASLASFTVQAQSLPVPVSVTAIIYLPAERSLAGLSRPPTPRPPTA
jgi:hypothetical protein